MGQGHLVKVLHVISKMSREGAQTFIMNLYRNINRNKVQFDFLINSKEKAAYDDEIRQMGGRLIYIPGPSKTNIFRYANYAAGIIKENGPYQCVHGHSLFFNGIIAEAAYKAGVLIRISHAHSSNDGRLNSFTRNIYRDRMRHKILKYSTDLFGCSKEACEFLFGERCFNDNRVRIINNGIETEKFVFNEEIRVKMREELGIKDSTIVVGHVGRFSYPKNHDFLIDIFKKVNEKNRNTLLLLVGDGNLREAIERKVEYLGLSNRVIFAGIRSDVADVLQAMDIFVFPSLYEGLPVTLVEAQASGLPCVISDNITKQVQITDLIHPVSLERSPEYWSKKILEVTKDSLRIDTSSLIRENNFDIYSIAKTLTTFYSEV